MVVVVVFGVCGTCYCGNVYEMIAVATKDTTRRNALMQFWNAKKKRGNNGKKYKES